MAAKKPMKPKPTAKRGAKGDDPAYRPRMTDPVSGRKLVKGQPVDAAYTTPPRGSVKDPVSGDTLQQGRPVPTAYSGGLNQQVGLGLRSLGGALAAGFHPPDRFAKGKGDPNGVVPKRKPAKKKKG